MKKLNYFLSLLLLSGIGGSSVQAQDEGANVYFLGDLKSSITPGEEVFLKSKSSGKYLDVSLTGSNNGSETLSDNCIFTFVDAGQVDGQASYYLQSKATGQYLKASLTQNDETGDYSFPNDYGNGPISYTSSTADAYQFFAGLAVKDNTSMFYSSQLTDNNAEDYLFVFPNVKKRDNTGSTGGTSDWATAEEYPYQYLSGYNAYFMLCMYIDTNSWQVYGVVLADGQSKLSQLLKDLFPSGVEGTFVEGNNPGNVPTAEYQKAVEAYNAAAALMDSGTATEEEYSNAANAVQAAYDAAVAAICPVKANTYYYITKNQNYAQGTLKVNDAGTGWAWTNVTVPTNDINYICYVSAGNTDSTFHIYSPATGTYMATLGGNSVQVSAVDESQAGEYLIKNCGNMYFYMTNAGKTQGVHAEASNKAVSWDYNANASHWQFVPVAQETIDELEGEIQKQQLATRMNTLFTKAFNAYTNARAYDSEASNDNKYTSHGLLSTVDQIWTSPLASGDGAGIPALLDNVIIDNWMHTTYTAADAPNNYHFIGVKLSEKANAVTVKYSRRISSTATNWKTNNVSYPTQMAVYASNDTTKAWTYIGTVTPKYAVQDSTLMASVNLYNDYQYIRFDVVATGNNATVASSTIEGAKAYPYFYVSEFGVYKGTYNSKKSVFSQVPEDVASAMQTALQNAAAQIDADAITEDGINQLQDAYDKFVETCPDPQIAKDALAAAQTLADSALVGDQPGYVSQQTLDALKSAITTEGAKVSDVMSLDDVNAVKTNLEAASDAFVKNVIMPSENTYYYMVSGSTANTNTGIKAGSNAEGATLKMGSKNSGDGQFDPNNAKHYYEFVWMLSKNEDGTYYVRNLGTGFYLKKNTTVKDAYPVTLVYSKGGMFHLIVDNDSTAGDTKYLNNNASSVNVWSLDTNCDYGFQAADLTDAAYGDLFVTRRAVSKGYTFMCLPYTISLASNGLLYTVVGVNNNQLILAENADVIEAGTPFVYYLEADGVTEDEFGVDLNQELVTTGKTVNGIVGVIGGAKVGPGFGVISNASDGTAKIIATTAEETEVNANTGYLTPEVPATTEAGDVQLAMEGEFTGINSVVVIPADGKYYDLQGRRVAKPTKGVYIVNGKKVYVK